MIGCVNLTSNVRFASDSGLDFVVELDGVGHIFSSGASLADIDAFFLGHDTSAMWPICDACNVTAQAIAFVRDNGSFSTAVEYAAALDQEIAFLVNNCAI